MYYTLYYNAAMQANSFTFQGSLIGAEHQTSKSDKPYIRFTLQSLGSSDGKTKPAIMNFAAFGYSYDRLVKILPNAQVIVIGKIGSREYNGKHYPDFMVNELHEVTNGVDIGSHHEDLF